MKTVLTASIIGLGLLSAAPVMAQGVYVGPGGVGVDTGIHPYRGYDRDWAWRNHHRDYYEGRSAYEYRDRRDRY